MGNGLCNCDKNNDNNMIKKGDVSLIDNTDKNNINLPNNQDHNN